MFDEDDVATGEFDAVELELDDDGKVVVPRVTEDWLWAMQGVVTRLRQKGKYEITNDESFRPVPEIIRSTVESAAGMVVAPTIASFYEVTDGYELSWNSEDGEAEGRVQLYGFAEVFGSWLYKLWGEVEDEASDAEEDFSWEIRGFDAADPESPFQVVMHTADVLPSYNLYWHAPRKKTYRIRIDFLEYLECLRETRGLKGWQYMVCDVDPSQDEEAFEAIARCTRQMKAHFPKVDLSKYNTIDDEHAEEE